MKTFYTVPVSYLIKLYHQFISKICSSIYSLVFIRTGKSILILFLVLAVFDVATAQTCPSGNIVYVNASATGANNGTSWQSAFTKLQDALNITKNCIRSRQIWVAKGTYYADEGSGQTNNNVNATFQLKDSLVIYGGFEGTEDKVSSRDLKANPTVLSGDIDKNNVLDGGNTYHVVTGSGTGNTAVLDGFVITGGSTGAMYNNAGSPSVTRCKFSGNSAAAGAGMFNVASNPVINNCLFSGNVANIGAGIYNTSSSNILVNNSTLSGNLATNSGGGIASENDGSKAAINNCIIWNNKDASGTGTAGASVRGNASYISSLVQNLTNSDGYSNMDGYTSAGNANYPLFATLLTPSNTPSSDGNFNLQSNSPVIDKGRTVSPPSTDLDGNTRVTNGKIDFGAYENQNYCPEGNIIYVDSSNVAGAHNGTSWVTAYNTLQDALYAVKNCTASKQIWVAKGTYHADEGANQEYNGPFAFFKLKNNLAIYGGFTGTETRLADRNWKINVTILSGDFSRYGNTYNLIKAEGVDNTSIIDGFTISDVEDDVSNTVGGGMYNVSASPIVSNCIFSNNHSTGYAGGINNTNNSNPIITNCSFSGNHTSSNGGAILNLGSSPVITNCSFSDNFSTNFPNYIFGYGGAISNESGSNPVITNCSFSGNNVHGFTNGNFTYGSCYGGAMYNSFSNPVITNCIFSCNSVIQTSNSYEGIGGAMYNKGSNPVITNCTFSGNLAHDYGGSMYNDDNSNPVITNCIIWNNKDAGEPGTATASIAGGAPIITYSLVQGITTADNAHNLDGITDSANANYPLFVMSLDLSTAPSAGGDFRLQCGSPAIDKGSNAADTVSTDLDGNPRIVNKIDLGVYETQQACCPVGNIIYVDSANASSVHDGTSWANAFTTLQDALYITGNCTGSKQVWVAKGTYYADEGGGKNDNDNTTTFQLKNNLAIYGGFAGTESSLEDRNLKTNITILSGDIDKNNTLDANNTANGVVTGSGTDTTAKLDGFTITGGYSGFGSVGAGMYNETGSPAVTNCVFSGNVSASNGGAMFNGDSASPVITNCVFSGNYASSGGGMYSTNHSNPVITSSTFTGNAADRNGGGMYNSDYSVPVITNCILWNNKDRSSTGTADANIYNNDSLPVISYSLVQGITTADNARNLDGITSAFNANYPLFITLLDPSTAPSTAGDFHLQCFSPAIDKGSNSADTFAIDLDGNPRIYNNIIDLGAYENQIKCSQSTITGITSSPDSSCKGSRVTFTGKVTLADSSSYVTTGSISFSQDSIILADSIPLNANGEASFSVDTLASGSHTITATYNAVTGFSTSNGNTVQTVNAAPLITVTNIIANTDANSCTALVTLGDNITITGTPTLIYKIGTTVISSPYTFLIGRTRVNVTATNICGSVAKNFTVNVRDKQPPVVMCKSGATKQVTGNYYVVAGTEFDATATDNCGTPVLIYSLSGATNVPYNFANTSLAGKQLNKGSTTIRWKASDASNNQSVCTTVIKVKKGSSLIADNNENTGNALTANAISTNLKVFASPNPSNNQFTLKLQSGSNANCRIMVLDITGRKIEALNDVAANSTIQIGRSYYPGVYVAVVMQGDEKVCLKLVKEGK